MIHSLHSEENCSYAYIQWNDMIFPSVNIHKTSDMSNYFLGPRENVTVATMRYCMSSKIIETVIAYIRKTEFIK